MVFWTVENPLPDEVPATGPLVEQDVVSMLVIAAAAQGDDEGGLAVIYRRCGG